MNLASGFSVYGGVVEFSTVKSSESDKPDNYGRGVLLSSLNFSTGRAFILVGHS
jgi:hypothetical protein